MTYEEFLKTKELETIQAGFDIDRSELNDKLFPFQADIVAWALKKGKAAIFSDCGTGKTPMQLEYAKQIVKHTGKKALIIAPLSVVGQTKKEGVKFGVDVNICRTGEDVKDGINITNYEMLEHFDADAFECVVLDECFAGDTNIEIVDDSGNVIEKEISNVKVGERVRNCAGIDKITAIRKKEVKYGVRIRFNGKEVICSPRHPFFTQRGWVCAKDLQKSDVLVTTDKSMRILRERVSNNLQGSSREEILRCVLLCEMENEPTRDKGEGSHERNPRKDREESIGVASQYGGGAKTNREDSQSESNERPCDTGESFCYVEEDGTRTFKAWGKWDRRDIATAVNDGCIARELGCGITYLVGKETARIPNVLQSRLGKLGDENCNRTGWKYSSFEKDAGQKERCDVGYVRLDSFEILEQGCSELDKYRDADGKLYFYDIEIERHPSFTVNGCLVHNSSILKSFTSATRNLLIDMFERTPYKLCCTASPAPNDHTEFGSTVEFLGIMTRSEMLATYFIHDGSNTSAWRLKGYGEKKFWEWVATWAVCVRNPADLGYSSDGYKLPNLIIHKRIVESKVGDYELVVHRAETLSERREARKESMNDRVEAAKKLVEESDESWIVWCDYNAESSALAKAIPQSVEVVGGDSPEYKAQTALDFADGKIKALVSKASIYGFGMNFQQCHNMIFCGISDSYEQFYQAVRRCWRYGQEHDVHVYIITSEKEMNVLENIERKQALMDTMQDNMIALMHDVTMSEIKHTTRITTEYKPTVDFEIAGWVK